MLTRSKFITYPPTVYNRDGLDHSLHCDPKYQLLLEHNATIGKYGLGLWGIRINYTLLPNDPEIRESIRILIEDWNIHHKFFYLMNHLSENEYKRFLFNYNCECSYIQRRPDAHQKKKEDEEKQKYNASLTTSSEQIIDSNNSADEFDRLRVISEYGW